MGRVAKRVGRLSVLITAGLFLAACGLPRAGPTESEIRASAVENGGDIHIVDVSAEIARATSRNQTLGFGSQFLSAGPISAETISPGDSLDITVWENVDNGIFATQGAKVTALPNIHVDQLGNIFMPYAGTLRASGRTAEQLRVKLTELLSSQTPDPQVEVRRTAGLSATVSILGSAGAQGVFPIEAATNRLAGMLATAGGVKLDPAMVKITVRRGNATGSIWMQDLFDNSSNDIALRPGDQIILTPDDRYFISMGTTGNRRVQFQTHNPTTLEALAIVGGLSSYSSNPKGIFVFRIEQPTVANRVLGRTDITTPQKFAYVVDLTQESSMFIAKDFLIVDQDTIYVTEAPYVKWRDLINTLIGSLNTVTSLDTAVTAVGQLF